MSRVIIKRAEDYLSNPPKGHYSVQKDQVACVCLVGCPQCGVVSLMSTHVHSVASNGDVSPSYVCPHTRAWEGHEPCSFHAFVTLEGWNGA